MDGKGLGVAAGVLLVLSSAAGQGPPSSAAGAHPVITEALFNVPKGDAGDANRDGSRHSAGDEFVELFNPHSRAIDLRGYAITNRLTTGDPETKRGVRFVFPGFELPPGGVAVLFNGCESAIPGPVGSAASGPAGPNGEFGDAWVFSMRNTSRNRAFSNSGDFVLLSAPDGTPLDALGWGKCDPEPPEATARVASVRTNPRGSVQRVTADGSPEAHVSIDGRPSSPGEIPPSPSPPDPNPDPKSSAPP